MKPDLPAKIGSLCELALSALWHVFWVAGFEAAKDGTTNITARRDGTITVQYTIHLGPIQGDEPWARDTHPETQEVSK